MALLDYEGFDRETNASLPGWFGTATSVTISADLAGVFGYGRAVTGVNSCGRYLPGAATLSDGWVNLHYRSAGAATVFDFLDNVTQQMTIGQTAGGLITATRGGGVLLATSTVPITLGVNNFFQIRYVCANAGGIVEVWVNGVKYLDYTGDTQNTANAYWNYWRVNANSGAADNIVIYSAAGAAPNARTPETRVISDLPNGAGATTEFTPSAGANFQCADEQPNDGDTTRNAAAAAVLTDTYACPATVPAGSIVYAVAVELVARKDDAGVNEIDPVLRSAGTNYPSGAPVALTTTYARYRAVWTTDPATGAAWASSAPANAAEPGVRRTS